MEHEELIEKVKTLVDFYRGIVLDAVENAQPESWPQTRSKILKALGDRGLEGKLLTILENYLNN